MAYSFRAPATPDLNEITSSDISAMTTFLYRCPKTRLNVQGWLADAPPKPEKQSYDAVTCLACGGVHLVNPASGKTIDDEDSAPT